MLHVIGDSHANLSFGGLATTHYVGPVTLKRVGNLKDILIPAAIEAMGLCPDDILLFCFGEIDMRCYVKPNLEHRKITMDKLLQSWADAYIDRICLLNSHGARFGIVSITPPSPRARAQSIKWPVNGSDKERAIYTRAMNRLLVSGCKKGHLIYLDIYSIFADANGMLPLNRSDGSVHIDVEKSSTLLKNIIFEYIVLA